MDYFSSKTGMCGRLARAHPCFQLSLFGLLILAVSLNLAWVNSRGQAQTPTPTATETPSEMIPITDMMVPPTLPENPTQADLGKQVYYYVCMACHGDKGQGLTPEWVEQWGLERNTCWQSKCHAANHPPDGFVLPRTIPGVVGSVLTNRFSSALALHDYIRTAMPWHAPGSLKEEEYWQLTAYLLELNGIQGPDALDTANAASISWGVPSPTLTVAVRVPVVKPAVLWVGAGVVLGVLAVAVTLTVLALRRK